MVCKAIHLDLANSTSVRVRNNSLNIADVKLEQQKKNYFDCIGVYWKSRFNLRIFIGQENNKGCFCRKLAIDCVTS